MCQRQGLARFLRPLCVCFVFWVLITWSFAIQELIAGAVISLGVALFAARFFIHTGYNAYG